MKKSTHWTPMPVKRISGVCYCESKKAVITGLWDIGLANLQKKAQTRNKRWKAPSSRLSTQNARPLPTMNPPYSENVARRTPSDPRHAWHYWNTCTFLPQALWTWTRNGIPSRVKHQVADTLSKPETSGGDTSPLHYKLPVLTVSFSSDKESMLHGDSGYELIEETQTPFTPFLTELLV